MEDERKNRVPGLPWFANRPPVCPKGFAMVPPPITLPMAPGSYRGRQQPYFMNQGMGASGSGTKPNEQVDSIIDSPSIDILDKKLQTPYSLSRNPITSIAPSSTNDGGITVKTEQGIDYELKWGRNMDPNMDTKRLRRILSNRISARKTRMRKLQYTKDLEKMVKDLQAEITVLNPRVESEIENHKQLRMKNQILKQKMRVCEDKAKLSLAAFEEYQTAVKGLKELHLAQQKMRMQIEEPLTLSWNRTGIEPRADSRSHGVGPQPMEDPSLDFWSLTIDPPKSLM